MLIENIGSDASQNAKRNSAYKVKAVLLILLILIVTLYINLPVFSNMQASSYFGKHYEDIKHRYNEMEISELLPVMRLATTETIISNSKKYLSNQSIPHININVDFNAWQAIKAQRDEMLGKKFMGSVRTFHKATVQYNGKTIPVKIRLKGGRSDHIDSPKRWSFRIKTRKGKSLFGMKTFALQHPKTRGYHREAVFHDLAQQKDILSLQYFYVDVFINGENIGTMAVEEVPAKELLERQQRKEGLLYKFSDKNITNLYHATVASLMLDTPENKDVIHDLPSDSLYAGYYMNLFRLYYNSINAPIQEISHKQVGESYLLQRPMAVGLLKGFLEGHLEASKVFDAHKIGEYFAYLALWGDSHASSFRNARYYFNPYTYKFEPILNDSNAYSSKKINLYPNRHDIRDHEINRLMMRDPIILNAYLKSVDDYIHLVDEGDFFNRVRLIEKKPLSDLREEFWFLPPLELSSMKSSVKEVKKSIERGDFFEEIKELVNDRDDPVPLIMPVNFRAPQIIEANIIEKENRYFLDVHNLFPLQVKISSLSIKVDGRVSSLKNHLREALPIKIDAFYYNQYLSQNSIELHNLAAGSIIEVSGTVQLQTQEDVSYPFVAGKSYPALKSHPLDSQSVADITAKHPFIDFDKEANEFSIDAGTWTISDFIIFPENATLTINSGTKLLFNKESGFFIKGGVDISGTSQHPVILDAVDAAAGMQWAGVTVFDTEDISSLNHVHIKNTSAANHQGWNLTAGVNFYKADVNISNSYFENTIAEDALNIVHSKFTFIDSTIEGTRSDGFDADYADGYISGAHFNDIGGDAIDFSGSDIRVSNSIFNRVHDKAVSAGENTNIQLVDIEVNDSGTGFAVKDGSTASIRNSVFKNIEYATLMSYTKKNVYGPAKLEAKDIKYEKSDYALISQKGNSLYIDDVEVEAVKVDIKKLYSKGYMKK